MISKLISSWSESITVGIAGNRDAYNQITYTNKVIIGRLIFTTVISRLFRSEGLIPRCILYTTDSTITIHSKVNGYYVTKITEFKDRYNVIKYYTYELGDK